MYEILKRLLLVDVCEFTGTAVGRCMSTTNENLTSILDSGQISKYLKRLSHNTTKKQQYIYNLNHEKVLIFSVLWQGHFKKIIV